MGIGTSQGAFYDDEFHYESAKWDDKYDDNVVTPPQMNTNKALDKSELDPTTGLGIEVDYKTASPLVTITDEDIDKATGLALSFSGGLSTKNVTPFRRGANDNIPDLNNPNMTKIDQLARKLGEAENGKGSWDRIGGGGQEHYLRDARKAYRNDPDAGMIRDDKLDQTITQSWKDLSVKQERNSKLIDEMASLRDKFVDRDWSEIEYAKYNKLGKELHGKNWETMTPEILNKPLE